MLICTFFSLFRSLCVCVRHRRDQQAHILFSYLLCAVHIGLLTAQQNRIVIHIVVYKHTLANESNINTHETPIHNFVDVFFLLPLRFFFYSLSNCVLFVLEHTNKRKYSCLLACFFAHTESNIHVRCQPHVLFTRSMLVMPLVYDCEIG